MRAAILALALCGCGQSLPSPVTARVALNHMAESSNRLGNALVALCAGQKSPECDGATEAFNDSAAAHRPLQDFLDAYDATVAP